MSNYILGKEGPKFIMDAGSGPWCSSGRFEDKLYYYKLYLQRWVEGRFYLKYRGRGKLA